MNKDNIDDCKRIALALLASLPISIRTKVINEANKRRAKRVGEVGRGGAYRLAGVG